MSPMNPRLLRPLARRQAPGTPASLLLRFDGNFNDSSPNAFTPTANGGPSIDATIKKYGSGSGYFGGGSNRLTIPDSAEFTADGDFTIEAWLRPVEWNEGFDANHFCSQTNNLSDNDNRSWGCFVFDELAGFYFAGPGYSSENVFIFTAASVQVDQWVHYAATIASGTLRVFINGVKVGEQVLAESINDSTADLCIGTFGKYAEDGYPGLSYTGFIDDLRVVRGLAVYQSDYVPPTSQVSLSATVAPPAPYGTFLFSECVDGDLTGTYANGTGGRYTEIISAGSC
jgi:hypothetical protein